MSKMPKDYVCDLCNKHFSDRSNYYKHTKNNKRSCLSVEECRKLKVNETKLHYFEDKTSQLEEDCEKLQEECERLQSLITNGIVEVKNELVDIKKQNEFIEDIIESKQTGFYTAYNNCVVNNSNNKNMNFSIKFTNNEKERLDHIPKEQMLYILDQEDFAISIGDLVEAVYFNPKAPENIKWCITDKNAKLGALEYNHESNTIVRKMTRSVIIKNLQSILFGMTDVLDDLKNTCSFNQQQGINYSRYFDMVGAITFKEEYIKVIKERAYADRNFAKALWDKLQIALEKTDVGVRVNMK